MKELGKALLSRKHGFLRYSRKVERQVGRAATEIFRELPELSREGLEEALFKQFELHPLEIGALYSVEIAVERTDFYNSYHCRDDGHLAKANVFYDGSPAMWSFLPNSGYQPAFRGRVNVGRVSLRTYLSEKDFDSHEEEVQRHLALARKAVNDFAGPTVVFNLKLQDRLKELVANNPDWVERCRAEASR